MFGRKIKQWFTLGRTVTLLIALVGLGLLVGWAVGTLAGRDTETVQAASVAPEAAPSKKADTAVHAAPVHAENTPQPRAESPPRDNQAAPVPLATSEPEPRIALAPVPDRDRPARRLTDVL